MSQNQTFEAWWAIHDHAPEMANVFEKEARYIWDASRAHDPSHDALCEALHNMVTLAGYYFTDEPQKLALAQARAALAQAKG